MPALPGLFRPKYAPKTVLRPRIANCLLNQLIKFILKYGTDVQTKKQKTACKLHALHVEKGPTQRRASDWWFEALALPGVGPLWGTGARASPPRLPRSDCVIFQGTSEPHKL